MTKTSYGRKGLWFQKDQDYHHNGEIWQQEGMVVGTAERPHFKLQAASREQSENGTSL